MERIQIMAIVASLLFLAYIGYLIVKGRLREEYSIVWLVCTAVLIVFAFWRQGLDYFSQLMGIKDPPNMVFTGAIFAVLIYLLHLSIVASRLQKQNKELAQKIALLEEREKAKTADA